MRTVQKQVRHSSRRRASVAPELPDTPRLHRDGSDDLDDLLARIDELID